MSWIRTVDPDDADGALAELYRHIGDARGGVAGVHRVLSLEPSALEAHLQLYRAIVFGRSPLPRRDREAIGVVVSRANGCDYCVQHHAEALRRLREDPALVDALAAGELPATLPPARRELLRWTRRIALEPASTGAADLDALRALGHGDRALLGASLTAAYFAFVNRVVLSLGVALEPDFQHTCGPGEREQP